MSSLNLPFFFYFYQETKIGRRQTQMASVNWSTTLTFVGIIMILIPMSATNPLYRDLCLDDVTYAANSSYSNNLNTVLGSLVTNATDNPTGFFTTSAGSGANNTVYGAFLCRGDQSKSGCHDCVSTAVSNQPDKTKVGSNCYQKKVVTMWYDECMIRYDNQPIYGRLSLRESIAAFNQNDMPGDQASFVELLLKTTRELASQAANGPPQTGKKYANVAVNFNSFYSLLYCMVQCTPDMSASDCNNCSWFVINRLPFKKSARVLLPNCNVRYEVYPFLNGTFNFSSPAPPPTTESNGHKNVSTGRNVAIIVSVTCISVMLLAWGACLILKKKTKKHDIMDVNAGADISIVQTLQYDLLTLESATDNFSPEKKLGEGGFGGVYKGTLASGERIAVKKLSKSSSQGILEFKNEVLLVAKLQHRNLVRILGFCLTGVEKLLVYEYVPKKSLDYFLFKMQGCLNWGLRHKIIGGIARGMLYLHQDSRLRIIHRDLKANNILLDEDMSPKISDFGMAKMFGIDETHQESTTRIVGTYGYMSPKYVMRGQFSIKSDVYSFGVLILEIISGMRNNSLFQSSRGKDLFSYAWKMWEKGMPLDFVDPTIKDECSADEVIRCLHLALLCIDESPDVRPTMATIVLALDSYSVTLQAPTQPIYYCETESKFTQVNGDQTNKSSTPSSSLNEVSITELHPR